MALSDEDLARIRPYVSHTERSVFALSGLPEEVIAVLFAYYSRSRESLRENLARLLADQELAVAGGAPTDAAHLSLAKDKARAFHEKWVVGYGHASVAEHAVVHLALEDVSIVASKHVEDMRLASYTEKSTRYVLFDEDSFARPPNLPQRELALYERAARRLFATYLDLVPKAENEVRRRFPRPESQPERAYDAVVRAKTFDILRGLLPAGTRTNLGLTANARALEACLSKMLSSPLVEVQELAKSMHEASATVAPTLVKYVAPNEYRHTLRALWDHAPQALRGAVDGACRDEADGARGAGVRLLRVDEDALQRVALALAFEAEPAGLPAEALAAAMARADQPTLEAFVHRSLDGRGKFDAVPRAFEAASLLAELTIDYGAYRDMQRHRMLSPFPQRLGCELGAEVPVELVEMGLDGPFRDALEVAEDTWRALVTTHPWEAQYVVPLAYRVRVLWSLNLREVFHVVELRSAKQGHTSYRQAALGLEQVAVDALPWLRGKMRADRNDYALPRA
jgi:thymidylate synthase ThyX